MNIFCQAYYTSTELVSCFRTLCLGTEINSLFFFLVIFSRVDPEKKLIMGFRKASVAQSSVQVTF